MKPTQEALEPGEHGHLWHPSKQRIYANLHDVEKLFPNLGPEAHRYLETVTSESYRKAIERLQHYTGKNPRQINLPSMMASAIQALDKVTELQRGHEQELEKLALDIVLNLPEFKVFKKWKEAGHLKFDVRLINSNLDNAIASQDENDEEEQAPENELAPEEQADLALADAIKDASDGALKRKFANMLTQGNAVNKLYLFQLANAELDRIDPNLSKLYGLISIIVQTSYYALPHMAFTGAVKEAAVGSEEVIPDEDGYTIIALSPYFPYLIHEIVKGCWDLLSVDVTSNEELGKETLDDEVMDIMSGPQLYTNLAKLVPNKELEYLPYVYRLLLKQNPNTIKEVLAGGGKAQTIINRLLSQAKETISAHEQPSEEPWTDTYGDNDEENPV